MNNHFHHTIFAFAIAISSASLAYGKGDGPTGLNCGSSQSLWVYEVGNRGSLPAPSHKDGGQSLSEFEVWATELQTYWVAYFLDLPSGITAAKTLENIQLEAGSESSSVPLGEFLRDPTDLLGGGEKISSLTPQGSETALGFNLEIDPGSVFGEDFDGAIFYVVPKQAQLEYVRLALCSDESAPLTAPVVSTPQGVGNAALMAELAALQTQLVTQQQEFNGSLEALTAKLESKNLVLTAAQDKVLALENQLAEQQARFEASARIWKILCALVTLLALALAGSLILRPRLKSRGNTQNSQERPAPERPPKGGIIFSDSPLVAGAVAAGPTPLAPVGKMAPSGLQTLTGRYAALKPAYQATGRIGGPQVGKPTNDDVSFGTGFLITPNHIMTNQHVYEFYKHYLTGPECGGIEFIAERDRDASDYVAFNGEPPVILPELDIAIFKLSRPVTHRKPIDRIAVPTDDLNEREVITISYPCPFEVDEPILSVVEKDPIFAVKRLSQGRIFRHSTDTDTPFGVHVNVDARINANKSLLAICHNASTLGGSSGAPILDRDGRLVGVHFAGDRSFNGEEAANLAMAIEMIADANPNLNQRA